MFRPFRRTGVSGFRAGVFLAALPAVFLLSGCSFDYGVQTEAEAGPDIIMREIEYVRVLDGDPLVRFRADKAERWEKTQIMELGGFSFEQFENSGENVNSRGSAGMARVELSSGNISMEEGVSMEVESEDFRLETRTLHWQDEERRLAGGENSAVDIQRSDGTFFRGTGFSADVRRRSWVFSGGVEGSWVHDETEEEETE